MYANLKLILIKKKLNFSILSKILSFILIYDFILKNSFFSNILLVL